MSLLHESELSALSSLSWSFVPTGVEGVRVTPFSTTAPEPEHGCACASALVEGLGVAGTFALQPSSSEDEEESGVVCVLDPLEFPRGFLDEEILPAFPETLPFLESSSSEDDDDEEVIAWGCVFEAELVDFAGTCAFLAAAEASSSDEEESEVDGAGVFFAAVEFEVDFGVTEDVCSLAVLVLVHAFKLGLGFEDFLTGNLSSSEDEEEEDESGEEGFLAAGCLDTAACACLGLDLGGAGF